MSQLAERGDEVDLGALYSSIWKSKVVVGLIAACFTFVSGIYAFVLAVPEYEASIRFELLDDQSSSSFDQFGGLAALAGVDLGGASSEAETLESRILSRPFIDRIYDDAKFGEDPVFNGTLAEPGLTEKLIKFVFGEPEKIPPTRNDYLVGAAGALAENMSLVLGENGIIELRITHPDPVVASRVANVVVQQSLDDIFQRKRSENRDSLTYFADELLQVRSDLDSANAAVRDYAINNNLLSVEELARTSAQLSKLRNDLSELEQGIIALEQMSKLEIASFDAETFVTAYPVSSGLTFRRLLNLPSDPAVWSLPSVEEIDLAVAGLTSQQNALKGSIANLEIRAMTTGQEAIELSALEREVQVQQAIYESVITQFEAQTLFSGFEQASGRVIEDAIPPNRPARPRKLFIVFVGGIFGLLVGAGVAIALSSRRGTIFGRKNLAEAFNAQIQESFRPSFVGPLNTAELSPRRQMGMADTLSLLPENARTTLVISPNKYKLAAKLALSLSKAAGSTGGKIALMDLSSNSTLKKLCNPVSGSRFNQFSIRAFNNFLDIVTIDGPNVQIEGGSIDAEMERMLTDYKHVFVLCPGPNKGLAASRLLARYSDSSVVIMKSTNVDRENLEIVNSVISRSSFDRPILAIV